MRSLDVGVVSIGAECVRAPSPPASKQKARSQLRRRLEMHTLFALLVAVAAACAIARPPGPTVAASLLQEAQDKHYEDDYEIPKELDFSYEDSPRVMPRTEPHDHDYLDKEIERLGKMDDEAKPLTPMEIFYQRISESTYRYKPYSAHADPLKYNRQPLPPGFEEVLPAASVKMIRFPETETDLNAEMEAQNIVNKKEKNKPFALTPLDEKFFEPADESAEKILQSSGGHHEGGDAFLEEIDPRQTRQNPISRTKNLIADNLDQLKSGFTRQAPDHTDKPGPLLLMESQVDAADSIYGIALIAAVGAALSMTIVGFAFGWYTLSKKAKAAADVDYPAYGVTGPTIDTSGDRKLAHSAHMYHYQHQKQQIIAMERNGLEQRNGSISDPESEEENEEGDYTVYECPGFATTGEMEVKNPMFSDDPTPATPGKCEFVKPQPKH